MPYTIFEHAHRFASWAASTAARSSKGSRFTVETGKAILEQAGFNAEFLQRPLPHPDQMDERHAEWRMSVIESSSGHGCQFTHGVAAKIINMYLKAAFATPGKERDRSVAALHPPIDRILLSALEKNDLDRTRQWRSLKEIGWSNFDSETYQRTIGLIREERGGKPLWTIEEHWRGYQ